MDAAQLRAVLDPAPVGVWVVLDNRIVYANPTAFRTLAARSESDLLGRPPLDFMHPDDRVPLLARLESALNSGETVRENGRLLRLDRAVAFVEFSAWAIPWNDGSAVQVAFTDVTQRRSSEQAHSESEATIRALLESASQGIIAIDQQGLIVLVNRMAERLFGYPASELIGQPLELLVPRASRDRHAGDRNTYFANPRVRPMGQGLELRAVRKDGIEFPVDISLSYVHTQRGLLAVSFITDITSRKRAEEERERDLRALADSIPQLVWVAAADGGIVWYNQRWYQYTGTTPDEMRGWGWQKVHHPEHLDRVVKFWKNRLAAGEPWEDTFPLRGSDGQYRWFLSRAVPLRDSEGRVIRWFGTNTDITDRLEIEDRLRHSEDQAKSRALEIQAIMDAVPAAIFVTRDPESAVMISNRAGYDVLRLPAGSNPSQTAPPQERPANFRTFKDGRELPPSELPVQSAARTGQPINHCEFDVVFSQDDRVHLFGNAVPLFDSSGRLRGAVGAFIDITERKRMEDALRESEHRFRVVADAAPVLIWTAGPDMRFEYFNKPWLEFTGRPIDQELGQGWMDGLLPDDAGRYRAVYRSSFEARASFQLEYRLRRRDGEYRWLLGSGVPRFSPSGAFLGFIGSCIDIHDRKQAEAALESTNVALRRANADLEQFNYLASHDLQEPLRTISSFAQLMHRKCAPQLSDEGKTYLDYINNGALRMSALIRDLLAYSRATADHERTAGPVDLTRVLSDVLQSMGASIRETEAEIAYSGLPVVRGDQPQLTHVFQNLISNAIKYRKPGVPPRVAITANLNESKNWLITVSDNGAGFDPRFSGQIFGLFKRLHDDTIPGTGVGLAICKAIVERHGGEIWAQSALGEGATFFLILPAADATQ